MTQDAFAQMIIGMQDTLYRICASLLHQRCDQEDAVQSALEKALDKKGTLRDERNLQGWVVRILINECYALLRKRKRELPVEKLPEPALPQGADKDLYRFFCGLPEKLRLPMVLFYVEGYSMKEIANLLHLPGGTVKSRLFRGRNQMRQDDAFKEVQDL